MVLLDGNPVCARGHSGTVVIPALYNVVLYQTVVIFCKLVNPAEGKKYAQVWCPLARRSD